MSWGAGLHAPIGGRVDESAYWQYVGRWSHLFVPSLLAAAEVATGDRVLDVATGLGGAALMAMSAVGDSGLVVGADISRVMLHSARGRSSGSTFRTVATDGEFLGFRDGCFDAVICQLGLMFFPNPVRGLAEARRVLRPDGRAAVCVIASPARAPMWGVLAESLSRRLPEQARVIQLSFVLSDSHRLEEMFRAAGFHDIRVRRETRKGIIESFDEFWAPIEAGTGLMPQAYLALPESSRRAVRDEVREGLSQYEVNGRLVMSVEMLIAAGAPISSRWKDEPLRIPPVAPSDRSHQ